MLKISRQNLKNKKGGPNKTLKARIVNSEPNAREVSDNKCPNCNRVFLRNKPMQKHLNSKKCIEAKKTETLEEIIALIPVMQALGLANNFREVRLNSDQVEESGDSKSRINLLYCSPLKGSAMKTKVRKNIRFTAERKRIMEKCFDAGETDRKNIYMA